MKTFKNLIFLFALLIVAACAHIVPPSGGLKDITPPKLVKAKPDTFSTNFNATQIKLDFDEFVQLKDEMSQIVISPLMDKFPDFKAIKKSIIIKFKEKLKDSTTYNINFGNSIADTHEGNIKEGFQYVFSTGTYVDSLTLSGRCKYAKDLKSDKGILVMLYKSFDDSVPSKKKPDYFAKTDSAGRFKINNIKEGEYKLFALKDLNSNYLFDQVNEIVGFRDLSIKVTGNDTANLFLFEGLKTKQYIVKSSCEEFGKLVFIFNKPLVNPDFNILNKSDNDSSISYFEYLKNRDTVIYWFTKYKEDSVKMIVSDDGKVLDTLAIHIKPKEPKKKSDKTPKFLLGINTLPSSGLVISPEQDWALVCSHPITDFDSTKFILKEDTTVIKGYRVSVLDSTKKKVTISYKWKEGSTYLLSLPQGTFHDIFGLTNDTLVSFITKIKASGDYGSLRLKFKAPMTGSNYILQLMNDREEIVQQNRVQGDTLLTYTFLDPTKYKLKVIFDANNNGKWDTGNYYLHQQPEKVTYCKEIFTVRANWDIDASWTLE